MNKASIFSTVLFLSAALCACKDEPQQRIEPDWQIVGNNFPESDFYYSSPDPGCIGKMVTIVGTGKEGSLTVSCTDAENVAIDSRIDTKRYVSGNAGFTVVCTGSNTLEFTFEALPEDNEDGASDRININGDIKGEHFVTSFTIIRLPSDFKEELYR